MMGSRAHGGAVFFEETAFSGANKCTPLARTLRLFV